MTALNIVALGDSLTQGFVHGAVGRPRWSFPAILARALGLNDTQHRVLEDDGPGFPVDMAHLLSTLEQRLGKQAGPGWLVKLPAHVGKYLDHIEDYYERGPGARPREVEGHFHNLAAFGLTVNEALTLTPAASQLMIDAQEGRVADDLLAIPSAPIYRNVQLVLNPTEDPERETTTMIESLRELAAREPIDVLLLWLGNNDALKTVLHMELGEMPADFSSTGALERRGMRLTSEAQFHRDFERLTQAVAQILAGASGRRQVYVGTVPHVTIPPVTRGLGDMVDGYFEAYGRFYRQPDSKGGTVLTRQEVMRIDARIDAFNATIRALASEQAWTVIDTVGIIDRLAVKRNGYLRTPGQALRDDLAQRGYAEHPLLELDPIPSLLPYRVERVADRARRVSGGIFGLDQVHPSTIGYALIAETYLDAIKANNPDDCDIQRAQIDWEAVLAADELVCAPPALWGDLTLTLEQGAWLWDRLLLVAG